MAIARRELITEASVSEMGRTVSRIRTLATKGVQREMKRFFDLPEVNVAIFAFLLNLVWEFAQVPLFEGMPVAGHWRAIQVCARATAGDVAIALVAFWAVSWAWRSRLWILRPTTFQLGGFVAVGLVITVFIEWLSTQVLDRWAYSASMPTVPGLGVGLSPLLQWVLLPPLLAWFVRRQLT